MTFQLLHGDCHDLLPTLAGPYALVLVDPPYGTTQLDWDQALAWSRLWPEIDRLLAPNGNVLIFSAQPFTTDLINSNRPWYRYELIWRKTTSTRFLDANRRPLQIHEHIQVFGRGHGFYAPQRVFVGNRGKNATRVDQGAHYGEVAAGTYQDDGYRHPTTVLDYAKPNRNQRHSATEKPVELLRWLIHSYCPPGGAVLDFTIGSGSTAVAAVHEQRPGAGIERDPMTYLTAHRRLTAALAERRQQKAPAAQGPG